MGHALIRLIEKEWEVSMTCSIQKLIYTVNYRWTMQVNNHAPNSMSGSSAVPVPTSLPYFPSLFHIHCEACHDDSYKRSHRLATNAQTIHPTSWINHFTIASCKTGFQTQPHCHIHTHALTLTHASCTSALGTYVLDQIAAFSFDELQLHQSFGASVSILVNRA